MSADSQSPEGNLRGRDQPRTTWPTPSPELRRMELKGMAARSTGKMWLVATGAGRR